MQPQLAWEGWGLGTSPRHTESPWNRGAAGLSVWRNGLALPCLDPKQCGLFPQVQANPQDAQPLPGDCTEPITTHQEPRRPQGFSHGYGCGWGEVAPCQNL